MLKPEGKRFVWLAVLVLCSLPLFYANAERPFTENAPKQPIDFFHRVHVGVKQIQCGYCHRETAKAAFAGMPSTQLCMRCHRVVIPNHPEIKKLHNYFDQGKAVPWERVHHLPGFVVFNHKAHIAANVPCAKCHGDVARMDRLQQTAPLTMGWCVTCHRQNKAPTDCGTCHH
ncbi:MAG TPA: cytochrome c3 family protein [Armatimonadota bacterium]|jgi:predicted CXXCH cytochrome family protein